MKYEVTAVVAGLCRVIEVEAANERWARVLAKQELARVAANYSIQRVQPVGGKRKGKG